jgi:hypothetical protein
MITEVTQTSMPFAADSFESAALKELFYEAGFYVKGIRIEIVHDRKRLQGGGMSPAFLIGLDPQNSVIRILDSLNREERIEAIAHELGHLLLIHRFGLGLIRLKRPNSGAPEEVFKYFIMHKNCSSLLGQVSNTFHHLILIDYLKEQHGIESHVHLRLLHYHFHLLHYRSYILNDETEWEPEPLFAKGIIALEYDRLLGGLDRLLDFSRQTDFFRKAFRSAKNHFWKYGLKSIPTASSYREDVFSLIDDLGL